MSEDLSVDFKTCAEGFLVAEIKAQAELLTRLCGIAMDRDIAIEMSMTTQGNAGHPGVYNPVIKMTGASKQLFKPSIILPS